MRETHVALLYVAYPAFYYAFTAKEMCPEKGEDLMQALRYKILALHLTKGTSGKVSYNLIKIYFIFFNTFL